MVDSTPKPPVIQISLNKGFISVVDEIDADLENFTWFVRQAGKNYYASRSIWVSEFEQNFVHMHRVIVARMLSTELPAFNKAHVDHINGNGLDNRRCNLRLASPSENCRNTGKSKTNTSGYKGVTWDKNKGLWMAQITVHRKHIYLGRYASALEAAIAYNKGSLKYHGDFGYLNPIDDDTTDNLLGDGR